MTVAFEVESIFRIVNRASPTLTAILRQVRELNAAIDRAKANLATLGGSGATGSLGLSSAIAETKALSTEWASVAKNAGAARLAIGNATAAAHLPSGVAGGGGGRHQPPWLRSHVTGPGLPIPGGGHVRLGGGAAAAAGLVGYGAYQAAELEDVVTQLDYHLGAEQNEANHAKMRKIIQDAMIGTGFNLHDVGEASKQAVRMFQGVPGGGVEVLPELLKSAAIEARLKGTSMDEAMTALVGLAHMTKEYDPQAIRKLAPAFAFLSTSDPRSLSSIERAAGYSVPLLQSGLEIDPLQTLVAGTALARAGITSTKSGTWLRTMVTRAMPGSALQSDKAYEKHEGALYKFGLVDDQGKPTWFTDGKPDVMKLLEKVGETAPKIPLTERTGYELQLFGKQGAGAISTLTDPAVLNQVHALRAEMESDAFKNRYSGFLGMYNQTVTAQSARTAMQDFNVTLMDLGRDVLPTVNVGLHNLKSVLDGIRGMLPQGASGAQIGGAGLSGAAGGAAAGFAIGRMGGPIGAIGGAVIGGVAGVAAGYLEQQAALNKEKWKTEERERAHALADAIRGFPGLTPPGAVFPGGTRGPASSAPPIQLNLNIDGKTLAQAISEKLTDLSKYTTDTAASNGAAFFGVP